MRDRRPGFRYAQSGLQKQRVSRHPREVLMRYHLPAAPIVAALSSAPAMAQQPANPIDAFLANAKAAAQFDFTGTLARLCVLPQTAAGPDVAPSPPPERATWY